MTLPLCTPVEERWCPLCQQYLPSDQFGLTVKRKCQSYRSNCKKCAAAREARRHAELKEKNPEKYQERLASYRAAHKKRYRRRRAETTAIQNWVVAQIRFWRGQGVSVGVIADTLGVSSQSVRRWMKNPSMAETRLPELQRKVFEADYKLNFMLSQTEVRKWGRWPHKLVEKRLEKQS